MTTYKFFKQLPTETTEEWVTRMDQERKFLELHAQTHIEWKTHRNPYGCWICDYNALLIVLLDALHTKYAPKEPSTEFIHNVTD